MFKAKGILTLIFVSFILTGILAIIPPLQKAKAYGQTIYTFTFDKSYYNTAKAEQYDMQLFLGTLQGIVNRDGPVLYLFTCYKPPVSALVESKTNYVDEYWFNKFRQPGQWLSEYNVVNLATVDDVINTFKNKIEGITLWDPMVDATSNLAVTNAGVENAPAVMADGALHTKLISSPHNLTVKRTFKNQFSGVNAKYDAYTWAKTNYLDNGKCNSSLLSTLEDSYIRHPGTFNRRFSAEFDYLVKNKGFVFDLSPWDDEAPTDAPNQNITYDRSLYDSIIQRTYNNFGVQWLTKVLGFIPWYDKYSSLVGGSHDGVPGEWLMVDMLSHKGAALTDVIDTFGMANASFHCWAPTGAKIAQQPAPARVTLENKTYILYYVGDYDGSMIRHTMSAYWDDPLRGSVPVAIGLGGTMMDVYPDIMKYLYQTATPNEYFSASCSGAAYSNPGLVPSLNVWKEWQKYYQDRAGIYNTVFLLNGNGGAISTDVENAAAEFSREGLGGYNSSMSGDQFGVRSGNTAIARQDGSISRYDVTAAANSIHTYAKKYSDLGTAANFVFVRVTFPTFTTLNEITKKIKADHPEYNYEVVDPHTFFSLIRQKYNNQTYDSITVNVDMPSEMVKGEKYDVTVTVRNVGSATWTSTSLDRLGTSTANQFIWSDFSDGGFSNSVTSQRVYLSSSDSIEPQELKVFKFKVNAPDTAGTYNFSCQMVRDGVQWHGNVYTKSVTVRDSRENEAIITSISAPEYLDEGATGTVSVTVKNVGTATWTKAGLYKFGSAGQSLQNKTLMPNQLKWDSSTAGYLSQRKELDTADSIAPGQSKTFSISIIAPSCIGKYTFAGKMVKEGTAFFGTDIYKDITVVPSGRSTRAFKIVGSTLNGLDGTVYLTTGQVARVSITVQNTGTDTWTYNNGYKLGATSSNQLIFSNFKDGGSSAGATAQKVYLSTSEQIKSEETKTFTFDVTAPSAAGTYTVSVDMVKEGVAWFNMPVSFTVKVAGGRDALILNSNVSLTMGAGSKQYVVIEAVNTGANIWKDNDNYRLGAVSTNQFIFSDFRNGGYSYSTTSQRVYMNIEDTPINRYNTFGFSITAPSTPGSYTFSVQMVQDGVTWFGPVKTWTINVVSVYEKRVNCGGYAFTDSDGIVWSADQAYDNDWGYTGTTATASTTDTITMLQTSYEKYAELCKTSRKGNSFGYSFNVQNGTYRVVLLLAEIEHSASYIRQFNVSIEGQQYMTGFDIFKVNRGHDKGRYIAYNVPVTDGILNIDFLSLADSAQVNAIEVVQTSN